MNSIRRRLTRRLLLAVALPIVVGGAIVGVLLRQELIEQFDAALLARASSLAAVIKQDTDGLRIDSSPRFMRAFEAPDADRRERDDDEPEGDAFFQIWHLDGSTIARSASLGGGNLTLSTPATEAPRFVNLALPNGASGRAAFLRFRPRLTDRGAGLPRPEPVVLAVAIGRHDLNRTLETVVFGLAGCGLLVIAATFLIVPRVVTREFAPIEALGDQAARITAESLNTRFALERLPVELTPIGSKLNDLLGRLEESFARERRFAADLAHELRTPIAELRSSAEVSLKWPDARSPATDRDVLEISAYMESIVTRLLALARSESGQMPVEAAPVPMAALLAAVWRPLDVTATQRSLELFFQVDANVTVLSDPVVLRSILTNLLQNAVDYATAGGQLQVSMTAREGAWDLRVTNDVDGLAEEDVARLFDRFWRRDAARSGGLHAGLGLSLARSLATAIGAVLTAELETPTRLALTLRGLKGG